mmetsp:Transcript_927/g.2730  ORF Transcript_927/g.2730 Transcript_927/m.2730 type:complete len:232 (-) Transcript_927:64-759(-)
MGNGTCRAGSVGALDQRRNAIPRYVDFASSISKRCHIGEDEAGCKEERRNAKERVGGPTWVLAELRRNHRRGNHSDNQPDEQQPFHHEHRAPNSVVLPIENHGRLLASWLGGERAKAAFRFEPGQRRPERPRLPTVDQEDCVANDVDQLNPDGKRANDAADNQSAVICVLLGQVHKRGRDGGEGGGRAQHSKQSITERPPAFHSKQKLRNGRLELARRGRLATRKACAALL